jgi:hypothetical protein
MSKREDSKRSMILLKEPINFLKDDTKNMTISRKIALYLMKRFKQYNPNLSNIQPNDVNEGKHVVSLEVAWAYFEHMTLPRYLTNHNDENGNKKLDVAVPGEQFFGTKLYNPITTPINQMGDFGIGVGLYFATLRAFTVLMFLAGCLNLPNFIFFAGREYSDGQKGISWFLKGSAACNAHEWVPCVENCLINSPLVQAEKYRTHTVMNENSEEITFILKNSCDGALFRVGMINFGTVLLILLGMIFLSLYLNKKQIEFDIDEQTPQDYSILVRNPPSNAVDPEEWKAFFELTFSSSCDGGVQVRFCTIAVNNDELLHLLVKRRELLSNLKIVLPDAFKKKEDTEMEMEELSSIVAKIESESNCIQKLFDSVLSKYKRLLDLNEKIKKAAKEDHPVTSVFIMFETEAAQRHVLEQLNVSTYDIRENNVDAVADKSYLFRDSLVLDVVEAKEPSTIRWQQMNMTISDLIIKLLMTIIVLVIIVGVGYIVKYCNDFDKRLATTIITLSNVVFPEVAKLITSYERHAREEHMEVWLYFRIAFFRWVNTAVVLTLITVSSNDDIACTCISFVLNS